MMWKALQLACITGGALFSAYIFVDGLRDGDKWFRRYVSLRDNHPFAFFLVGSGAREMDDKETQRMTENEIGTRVIEAAIAVPLLNFGEDVMKTGITRCVNGLEE